MRQLIPGVSRCRGWRCKSRGDGEGAGNGLLYRKDVRLPVQLQRAMAAEAEAAREARAQVIAADGEQKVIMVPDATYDFLYYTGFPFSEACSRCDDGQSSCTAGGGSVARQVMSRANYVCCSYGTCRHSTPSPQNTTPPSSTPCLSG